MDNGESWAIKEILDRTLGKADQRLEVTGESGGPVGAGCQLADFDLDGVVGVPDLLILLANWG